MSSRQPITVDRSAIPCLIKSCALPSHTSVPWDKPDNWSNSAKVVGWVSSTIPRTKLVPNSGIPSIPVGVPICSCVTPRTSVPEKRAITSWSSIGISLGSIPDKSCNFRIMVGSSWPSTSSFKTFSSISWKLKWVVCHSAVKSSAGYWTGVKS